MAETAKITWDDSITQGVTNHKIYRDDVSIGIVGLAVGVFYDTNTVAGATYKYEVQAIDSVGESIEEVLDTNVFYISIPQAVEPPVDGLTPIMTNFRVEDATPTLVHFDTPLGSVSGISASDFEIYGKSISSVSANYFTLSAPLTHWDNNTIKLTGGNGAVYDFDLQDIENNIVEPQASTIRYGSRLGSGTQDGLSEANAWDWGEVDANAAAGMTIHVKAGGDFGAITLSQDGDIDSPIILKGYKTTPGDLDGVHYAWGGAAYDVSNVMSNIDAPTLTGSGSGTGFSITGDYIIVKNIQVIDYDVNIYNNGTGNILDNCYSDEPSSNCIESPSAVNGRISNCIVRNWETHGLYGVSTNIYYDNCKVYLDKSGIGADYFSHISGYNVKMRNLTLQKLSPATGGQHGLSLKGAAGPTPVPAEQILVENCTVFNCGFPIEARWHTVKNNVFRNIDIAHDETVTAGNGGHITMMNGPSFNIFDNVKITGGYAGVRFLASGEMVDAPTGANDNLFKNCLFIDCLYGIFLTEDSDGQNREYYNNEFINCTWYNAQYNSYVFINNESDDIRDNTISNCIINGRDSESTNTLVGFSYEYSNFYDSFAIPSGTGNINDNPTFEDTVDFRPTNDALISAVKVVDYDAFGNERADITTMGYFIDVDEVIEEPPSDFRIISYEILSVTATTAEVTATMTENCSINYYVDTVKNAVSSDDFNAFEVAPNEWRHTRTLTGLTPGTTANLIIEVTAEDDLEVVQSGNIPLTTLPPTITVSNTDGTADFSTIQAAVDSGLVAGDIVGLKGGDEFYESVTINAINGADGNPITFTSYGTGQAVIKGSKTFSGFTNTSGDIWEVSTGADTVFQVPTMQNARLPEFNGINDDLTNYTTITSVTSQTVFVVDYFSTSSGFTGDLVGGTVFVLTTEFTLAPNVVTAFNNATGEITISGTWNVPITNDMHLFVGNTYDLLSANGEWYATTDKVYVYSATQPTNIIGSIISDGIDIINSSYLDIYNLDIRNYKNNGIELNGSTYVNIKNNTLDYCYNSGVDAYTSANCIIDSNTFSNSISECVYGRFSDSEITNNTVTDQFLLNNFITHIHNHSNAIVGSYGFDNILIEYNNISNIGMNGVGFRSTGTMVRYNTITDYCLLLTDAGGIYAWGDVLGDAFPQNSTITNNIIIGYADFIDKNANTHGIYLDDFANGFTITDNSIDRVAGAGIMLHNSYDTLVTGNNIYQTSQTGIIARENGRGYDGLMVNNNISGNYYFTTQKNLPVLDPNNPSCEPMGFVWQSLWTNINYGTSTNNKYWTTGTVTPIGANTSNINSLGVPNIDKRQLLSEFQTDMTNEVGTTDTELRLLPFNFTSFNEAEQIPNSDFSGTLSSWTFSSTVGVIISEYLNVTTTGTGAAISPVVSTVAGESYLISFSADIELTSTIRFRIYDTVSGDNRGYWMVDIKPGFNTYQYKLDASITESSLRMRFELISTQGYLNLDDVSFRQSTFSVLEDQSYIAINGTLINSDIPIPDGTWADMDGGIHTNTINLNSYESKTLIKQ